jgi:hypothetical protein
MADPVNLNTIEALQRALFAHIGMLAGTRGTGTVTVTNETDDDVELPANSYMLPFVGGELDYVSPFKVGRNPDTVEANGMGGAWTIPANDSLAGVSIMSNVGGARHNLRAPTELRLDPPIAGLTPLVTLDASISDASNLMPTDVEGLPEIGGLPALVKRMVFWEQLAGPEAALDFFKAGAGDFPALLLAWVSTVPLQGRTSGGRQGNTRLERGVREVREGFVCYCGSARLSDPTPRRNEALVLMQAASRLLTDRQMNIDLEYLSDAGAGVEITNRRVAFATQQMLVYQFSLELNSVLEQIDIARSFGPWVKTRHRATLPGREAPEPTGPLMAVDSIDPLEPDDD